MTLVLTWAKEIQKMTTKMLILNLQYHKVVIEVIIVIALDQKIERLTIQLYKLWKKKSLEVC